MLIPRPTYLERLAARRHNGMVKVITGMRRSGKTFLLFSLFDQWLREQGVEDSEITKVSLDSYQNKSLRNPEALFKHVQARVEGKGGWHYVLLDEVQMVPDFEDVLNGFLAFQNCDVYVTGSNAKFLSRDIATEFRGRGDIVHVHPLSFREYMTAFEGSKERGLDRYMTYGGLPQVCLQATEEQKIEVLEGIVRETYIRDIEERHSIRNKADFEELLLAMASSVGSLTNPHRIADTFKTNKKASITRDTVVQYLTHLSDAFIVERAKRYDIKGRQHIGAPYKYYFSDSGIRNSLLGYSQPDEGHVMENILYNELRSRGFHVDVGAVQVRSSMPDGSRVKKQLEVDFLATQGNKRYYIQSAAQMSTAEKESQEKASLLNIDDSFKKIIVTHRDIEPRRGPDGIVIMGIYDFLLNPNSLEA